MAYTTHRDLENFNNWVAYELRPNPDNPQKPKKMPVNPHTGNEAKSNDASTWGTSQEAIAMATQLNSRQNLGCGIGFMFGEPGKPSGIAGIDIDNCMNDDGTLKDYAAEIVRVMNSYTEYSPSGKGLHILFRLSRSLHEIEPSINTGRKNTSLGIEIYDSVRFFTFTGEAYGEPIPIPERTEEAEKILAKYFMQSQKPTQPPAQKQIVHSAPTETDSELWEKMFNSKNGARIRRLYHGDISDYNNDDSAADMALCFDLAYWTNCDYSRIDSMFRQSGLYREKWERQDYRDTTISKAIAMTPEYVPEVPSQRTGDMTDKPGQEQPESPAVTFSFNDAYLDSAFETDIINFQRYSGRKTGFSNLDGKLILYPALYVIGAGSGLGKTTFNLQLADQLAQSGEHVLYFAFEQTRFELVSKSLARLCQPEGAIIDSAPTAMQIRQGRTSPELREAMQKYKEFAGHYAIVECNFTYDVSTIITTVEAYIKTYGVKPVVFVDYLQLIRSDNPKLTNTKDIVDANVRALKLLQMQHELIMFVVSSINRENYLTTMDFQSFKESGSIEFTADVVMGLQLAIMNSKLFEADSKTTKKRKAVKAAKNEVPRSLELCILKNRYGVSNENYYFHYYPRFDLFIPTTEYVIVEAVRDLINSIPDDESKETGKRKSK